jgi:hypothetical protein
MRGSIEQLSHRGRGGSLAAPAGADLNDLRVTLSLPPSPQEQSIWQTKLQRWPPTSPI